ncbi:MAG: cupredoxin domain-containing protein [Acidobacteria bacterium]|nr:cupredoxin domain-containing protein [Acidobacteriota bacterium]
MSAAQVPSGPPLHEIRLTAKKYEYNPREIRVKQGERVRLLITPTDRKHGFELKEFGVKTELPEGKETAIEFTPDRPGEFEFKCSVYCGWRHRSMKGKLIVEPATSN